MKRSVLDDLAGSLHLSEPAVALALDLTGARPDTPAWQAFALRVLNAAGIAALAAGIIFFVAANWQDYGLIGRFAILQAAFLASIAIAWVRPPPAAVGQAALVLATLVTGALLALFGQSYQTGADVHELFFTWAALALPFALAGRSGAVWATWWTILNVALALYGGLQAPNHFIWLLLDRFGVDQAGYLLMACFVDLAGAALFLHLARTRFAEHAPHWLPRVLASYGFLFGTAACVFAIVNDGRVFSTTAAKVGTHDMGVIVAFAVACAIVGAATLRARRDVFPLALIAGSWIAISTTFLVRHMKLADLGSFFLLAIWLIGTSTAAGFLLMRWVRAWRAPP